MAKDTRENHDNGDGQKDPVAGVLVLVVHLLQVCDTEMDTYKRAGSRWICCSTGAAMVAAG